MAIKTPEKFTELRDTPETYSGQAGKFTKVKTAENALEFDYPHNLIVWLTNRSGIALAEGDVVIVDSANDNSVTTTTTVGYELGVGVVVVGGANLTLVGVAFSGYVRRMWTLAAAGTGRGQFLETSATARRAALTGTAGGAGDFAVAFTHADANGYLSAILVGMEKF